MSELWCSKWSFALRGNLSTFCISHLLIAVCCVSRCGLITSVQISFSNFFFSSSNSDCLIPFFATMICISLSCHSICWSWLLQSFSIVDFIFLPLWADT